MGYGPVGSNCFQLGGCKPPPPPPPHYLVAMNEVRSLRTEVHFCPICELRIQESTGRKPTENAVECAGRCAAKLHRRCAGLTRSAFIKVCESEEPYCCPHCRLEQQSLELSSLHELVATLSADLAAVKSQLTISSPSPLTCSYAAATSSQNQVQPMSLNLPATTPPRTSASESERKYNLVISGVAEYEKGSRKLERQTKDLEKVSSILSSLFDSISSDSIKDVYRLGKYNTDDNRPRQLLVKMIRASDVTAVLTRTSSLDRSIYIRRDLPREVRVGQAVLRKERRRLIDSGVHYSDISVRGDRILVKTILYGSLDVNDRSRFTKDSDSPIVQSNVQPNDAQPLEIDESVYRNNSS